MEGGWVGGLFEYNVVANGLYSFRVDCRKAMNIAKEWLITVITDSKRLIYFLLSIYRNQSFEN